jgi:prepilin signal peptidase PulO-like enzyme (type II secretory pathway)
MTLLSILLVASLFDWRTRKVPNYLSLPAIVLAMAYAAWTHPMPTWWTLANVWVLTVLTYQWTKGRVGAADVKMSMVIVIMFYATFIPVLSMVFALLVALWSKKARTRFVPWLTIGTVAGLGVSLL